MGVIIAQDGTLCDGHKNCKIHFDQQKIEGKKVFQLFNILLYAAEMTDEQTDKLNMQSSCTKKFLKVKT